ncbi:hypothetical protein WUBG_17983 [Wuchereria bancrofti]|uniref:Uncharacterized protein n=1 Tax=Wuchereria bancrofti TaxID=6293 RepID=J9E6Z3_WUCBA|nr:hypothetical protein WUBG_17983 [Wuchereria bancrofti]
MKANRQKRSEKLASTYSKLFEQTSFQCANLENIVVKMCGHMQGFDSPSALHAKLLRDAGGMLFYHSTSSITSLEMIFPAVADSYGFVLAKLGKVCSILVAVFDLFLIKKALGFRKFPKKNLRMRTDGQSICDTLPYPSILLLKRSH